MFKAKKNGLFSRPSLFEEPTWENLLEFLDEFTPQKLERWGYCMVKISLSNLQLVPGASCYAVCGWLELLAAD